eukprot:CAMPEP_0114295898 /NCGR_PEP_ID=MMETSP0059-20121206/11017_1 /TAXON_ID=36894 /ORGANISM="Pyramimonas parkeae, Strain CCMP726" /LENGTH=163 /DNA_ID=CAMNT_0001417997 /DNA_START=305 /DNA_END=793 /DNA_ORIENTATION=-
MHNWTHLLMLGWRLVQALNASLPPVPPPLPPPVAPPMPPPPPVPTVVVPAVASSMSFSSLDINTFQDKKFRADFEERFKKGVAKSVGVTVDDVLIDDIHSGSVVVDSTVLFPSTATIAPEEFTAALERNLTVSFPAEFLEPYGNITVNKVSLGSVVQSRPRSG